MVSTRLVIFLAASVAPSTFGYEKYMAKIPNGDALGKSIGHSGSGYTPFGKAFSSAGASWPAVCKQPWPDQASITIGAALGDPCCKWTSGAADFPLSAPNLSGTVCPGAASPTMAPVSAPVAAPAAALPQALPAAAAGKSSGKGEVLCEAV